MAINDVSLTAGMRANLLALQDTVNLLNRTQSRLSTGKKVNTAIDNPVSFFASQALTSRASVIDSLKDAMGQAVQTITSADKGIKAITAMIEQAKGIAQSALSAAAGTQITQDTAGAHGVIYGTVTVNVANMASFSGSTVNIDVDAMTSFVASDVTFDWVTGAGNVVNIGGQSFVEGTDFNNQGELINLINGITGFSASAVDADTINVTTNGVLAGNITGNGTANVVVTTAGTLGDTIDVDGDTYMKGATTGGGIFGFADAAALDTILEGAGYIAETTGEVIAVSQTGVSVTVAEFNASAGVAAGDAEIAGDTIEVGGTTYMLGRATDGFANAAALETILTNAGYTAAATGNSIDVSMAGQTVTVAEFSVSEATSIAVDTPAAAATAYTIGGTTFTYDVDFTSAATLAQAIEDAAIGTATVNGTVVTVAVPSVELESLQTQYNTLRDQLTALAGDSGYKGKNLLNADTLAVKFEGTTLNVVGFDASAGGLGITEATWTVGGNIDTDVDLLDAALVTLRQESSKMSGNLSIITVRQEFSTNMINTLTEGADKLTLADTNEEGANMLMLQTRQSLSTTALSLSAQAAQSVLRLFQ